MNAAAKILGYIVLEACEEWEQVLGLDVREEYPRGGILDWCPGDNNAKRAVFATRKAARDAIERSEHMRLAHGWTNVPERKNCRIEPVVFVDPELDGK